MPHHNDKRVTRSSAKKQSRKRDRRLTRYEQDLRDRIEDELHTSHEDWKGRGVPIRRNNFKISTRIRQTVNINGRAFGCHSCLSVIANDKNQPWIGDHIPPTELKDSARQHYGCRSKTYLFPQCDECSSQQASLVKELNRAHPSTFRQLTDRERKLLLGGKNPSIGVTCVESTGPTVTVGQGRAIQGLGERNGCHSCGALFPKKTYHSDHVVPQEFVTSYMPQVFDELGIDTVDFDSLEVRPQCPRCSHRQGGNLSGLTKMAIDYARSKGITVYKY